MKLWDLLKEFCVVGTEVEFTVSPPLGGRAKHLVVGKVNNNGYLCDCSNADNLPWIDEKNLKNEKIQEFLAKNRDTEVLGFDWYDIPDDSKYLFVALSDNPQNSSGRTMQGVDERFAYIPSPSKRLYQVVDFVGVEKISMLTRTEGNDEEIFCEGRWEARQDYIEEYKDHAVERISWEKDRCDIDLRDEYRQKISLAKRI